jgi:hypothetical protein
VRCHILPIFAGPKIEKDAPDLATTVSVSKDKHIADTFKFFETRYLRICEHGGWNVSNPTAGVHDRDIDGVSRFWDCDHFVEWIVVEG